MAELDRLLAQYGEGYVPPLPTDADRSTADIVEQYRPPGKGERLKRAWEGMRAGQTADMARRAGQPLWGDPRWAGPEGYEYLPLPAKESQAADMGRAAVAAPLGARGGLGGSTGGMGWLVPRYTPNAVPQALYVEGGLGLADDLPWLARGFASQPRELLGAGVAPPLALTKKDATPLADADAYWEEAGKSYPLRAQARRVVEDFKDKPVYHTVNSLRQIPMAMGYTGAAEGAMALGALQRLPAWLRGAEPTVEWTRAAPPLGRSAP